MFLEGSPLVSNRATVTWTAGKHTTFLNLDPSPRVGAPDQTTMFAASLTDASLDPPAAIAGQQVSFELGSQSCSDTTDALGIATCAMTPGHSGTTLLVASFAGTSQLLPSSDSIGFGVLGCDGTGWDADVDATLAPLTDGLLGIRFLFGFSGATLVAGALGQDAERTDPPAIAAHLECLRATLLDIDGNGEAAPLTDGLLLLRYLFGFRGAALVSGAVGAGCTRCSAEAIETFIEANLPS
jgi:hypothetical protein